MGYRIRPEMGTKRTLFISDGATPPPGSWEPGYSAAELPTYVKLKLNEEGWFIDDGQDKKKDWHEQK